LNRLSARCNETLTIAAVLGREFTLQQLGAVVEGMTEDMLLQVLEEALGARVIEEIPTAVGRYQFTHALIQETLTNELSLTRRVRLHARIAERMEAHYGKEAEAHAAELAFHFAGAEAILGTGKLIRYSILAGEKSLAAHAYEEALQQFERALTAKGVDARDSEAAQILYGLGRAQVATVERHEAQRPVDTLERSFQTFVETGDTSQAMEVAAYPMEAVSGITRMTHLREAGLKLIDSDSAEAVKLLGQFATAAVIEESDESRGIESAEQAIQMARRLGDEYLEMASLTARAGVMWNSWRFGETIDSAVAALAIAERRGDLYGTAYCHWVAGWASLLMGKSDDAHRHLDISLPLAEKLRHRQRLEFALLSQYSLALAEGAFDRARLGIQRALQISPGGAIHIGQLALLEHERGNHDAGRALEFKLIENMKLAPPGPNWWHSIPALVLPLIALTTGDRSRVDIARQATESVVASRSSRKIYAQIGQAFIALLEQDSRPANNLYSILKSFCEGRLLQFIGMSGDRLLGNLTRTAGAPDAAAEHFARAADFCRRAHFGPELAWTFNDHADLLYERNRAGDRERAVEMRDESLAIARELGMKPLIERVISRKKILKA
jgi:tetratricopeptide (TPR) repeat protein